MQEIEALMLERTQKIRPFLADASVPRTGSDSLPGAYDELEKVWLIDTPTGPVPLIESASGIAEVQTKTKVDVESDDTTDVVCLEGLTKTDANMERDDQSQFASAFLEMVTKTMAQVEGDDDLPDLK